MGEWGTRALRNESGRTGSREGIVCRSLIAKERLEVVKRRVVAKEVPRKESVSGDLRGQPQKGGSNMEGHMGLEGSFGPLGGCSSMGRMEVWAVGRH